MFTAEQRDAIRERIVDLARSDDRVTAGALIGSAALGAGDAWSDIDITFGIDDEVSPEAVLDEWTKLFGREFGALHHFDLRSGASIYRVFLLPSGLEIDVSVTPQREFAARGPNFHTLFGSARQFEAPPQPATQNLMGLGWHHVLHARSSIERGKPWQAEYWIGELRNHTLALACLRLGENAIYARGVDRLPASLSGPFADTLVRSLDTAELRRALAAATALFLAEVEAVDPALGARLKPPLLEIGAVSANAKRKHSLPGPEGQ